VNTRRRLAAVAVATAVFVAGAWLGGSGAVGTGSATAGSGAANTGSGAVGSGAAESGAVGSGAAESGAVGSGAAGSGAVGSGARADQPPGAEILPGGEAEAEIRRKRERFNQAIVARDTAALATIWTEDVHVVASSGARISGRDTYRERFAGYFATRQGYTYRREPQRVHVHEPWGVATEHGEWRARWNEPDGPVDVGGEYMMHWRLTGDGWLVQAEMFAPVHCRGGRFCTDRP
jgi:uncharacterized protein (TIGR02246 family)